MFVHLLQALVIAVLFLFPFAYNVNDFSANFNSVNTCATVDSALIKYYSQTGSLPETLDAETIKKMGLDDKSVEGLTYKKLEDRKFVLSYEDSKSDVKESIHSNTLLPLSTVVNFGEEKPKYFFFEIDKVPHQTLEAKIDFPRGGFIIIREGDKVEVPFNSKYEVHNKADRGYKEGVASHTKGLVQNDIFVTATAAEMIKYRLSVQDSRTQNVLIDVNDKASNKRFVLKQGESALVGPGTIYNLKSITPISGYTSGSVFPSSGQVYEDTNIEVKNGEFKMYTVSVADTAHQTINVKILNSANHQFVELCNGEMKTYIGHNSEYEVTVIPESGYMAGKLNVPEHGFITKDTVFNASEAKKDTITSSDRTRWEYSTGYNWTTKFPFDDLILERENIKSASFTTSSKFTNVYLRVRVRVGRFDAPPNARLVIKNSSTGKSLLVTSYDSELGPTSDAKYLDLWYPNPNACGDEFVVKCNGNVRYDIKFSSSSQTVVPWHALFIDEFYENELKFEGNKVYGDRLTSLPDFALKPKFLWLKGEV